MATFDHSEMAAQVSTIASVGIITFQKYTSIFEVPSTDPPSQLTGVQRIPFPTQLTGVRRI